MRKPHRILVATGNEHKVQEIRQILPGFIFESLEDVGIDMNIIEDGSTFEENAKKKATVIAEMNGGFVLADDSGLVVEALNGEPGIYSARYAGEGASDEDNNQKLLRVLRGKENRRAYFACTLILAQGKNVIFKGTGICKGSIGEELDGAGGFGYDPLFTPDGYDQTFATLGNDVKNSISHRALALQQLREFFEAEE